MYDFDSTTRGLTLGCELIVASKQAVKKYNNPHRIRPMLGTRLKNLGWIGVW